jgi:hypothetical protein
MVKVKDIDRDSIFHSIKADTQNCCKNSKDEK